MRLIFLGTPQFAVPTLDALVSAGHEVLAVITQPDRPKGRGRQLAESPVKQAALRLHLPVFQPERIRRPEAVEHLRSLNAEIGVIVGYGQIIPQNVLDLAPGGFINVHASLLPKYRGAAPIQWAIVNGEVRTGVTTMKIDAGLDTGDILLKAETPIGPEETASELSQRLAQIGAGLLVETLERLGQGGLVAQKQNSAEATYAPILKKEDGLIDWRLPAKAVFGRIRGFEPWPGACTRFRGQTLHIWRARPVEASLEPGRVQRRKRELIAGCGQSTALELIEVQLEGRARMSGEAFANGQRLSDTDSFGEGEN